MYKAIAQIKESFEARNLKFQAGEIESHQYIDLVINGDSAAYHFRFIDAGSGSNNVAVRVYDLITVPTHKRPQVLRLLNLLHLNNVVFKFTLGDDDTVTAQYDFAPSFDPVGDGAVETLSGLTSILDSIHADLEQAVAD